MLVYQRIGMTKSLLMGHNMTMSWTLEVLHRNFWECPQKADICYELGLAQPGFAVQSNRKPPRFTPWIWINHFILQLRP